MLGHLSASIAHEVKQPISAVIMNAQTALRLLETEPADMEAVRRLLGCIVKDGARTAEIVERTRTLIKKAPPRGERLDINAAIIEAIEVTQQELVANGVSLQLKLAKDLPLIWGDRVQLQQVMLNLIISAIQAISACSAGASNLLIHSAAGTGPRGVQVTVEDSGSGIEPADIERIFEAFLSTKPTGLGNRYVAPSSSRTAESYQRAGVHPAALRYDLSCQPARDTQLLHEGQPIFARGDPLTMRTNSVGIAWLVVTGGCGHSTGRDSCISV